MAVTPAARRRLIVPIFSAVVPGRQPARGTASKLPRFQPRTGYRAGGLAARAPGGSVDLLEGGDGDVRPAEAAEVQEHRLGVLELQEVPVVIRGRELYRLDPEGRADVRDGRVGPQERDGFRPAERMSRGVIDGRDVKGRRRGDGLADYHGRELRVRVRHLSLLDLGRRGRGPELAGDAEVVLREAVGCARWRFGSPDRKWH